MTFYIPPVFLFGNKVRHNQEEKKSEYKTAAETEIKVENWNIKRIAELEEENKFLKAEIELLKKPRFSDRYLKNLEEENRKLKSDLAYERTMLDNVKAEYENLQEINGELKERIGELEKEIEELNKMMLFETELEK